MQLDIWIDIKLVAYYGMIDIYAIYIIYWLTRLIKVTVNGKLIFSWKKNSVAIFLLLPEYLHKWYITLLMQSSNDSPYINKINVHTRHTITLDMLIQNKGIHISKIIWLRSSSIQYNMFERYIRVGRWF